MKTWHWYETPANRIIRLHNARGCLASGDFRFIIVPYVSRLEEDMRPIVKYAIVDSLIGQVTKSGFSDEDTARAEVLSYYE